MRVLLHASLAGALLLGTTGCLAISAKTATPLNMPEPPSRVVTPPTTPVEPPPVAAPPITTVPSSPPAAGTTGTAAPPTAPPVKPPPNTTPPVTASPPSPETPVLQNTDNTAALDRKTLDYLDSARRDLLKVDQHQLSKDAQAQYSWAQQLYNAAEAARKAKNFYQASLYAEKAALMAALLVKSRSLPVSPTLP